MNKLYVKAVITLCGLLLLYLIIRNDWIPPLSDHHVIAQWLDHAGLLKWLSLYLSATLFIGIGGPRQAIAFLFGFLLGGPVGVIAALMVSLVGSLCCFYMARSVLHPMLERRFSKYLQVFEKSLQRNATLKIMVIRLLPVGSNLFTNLFSGACNLRISAFVLGSVIGFLPQTAVFAMAGSGVRLSDHNQMTVSILLFAISSALGIYLYFHREKTTKDATNAIKSGSKHYDNRTR